MHYRLMAICATAMTSLAGMLQVEYSFRHFDDIADLSNVKESRIAQELPSY